MAISISKMIDEVASTKYNKTNILLFILIMIVLEIVSAYTMNLKNSANVILSLIFGIVLYFIFTFIINGYYVTTSNNEIHNKKSVFPYFSFDIINKGFIFSLGCGLIGFILYFIPFIIMIVGFCFSFVPAVSSSTNMQVSLCLLAVGIIVAIASIVIMMVLSYFYYWPLIIQYLISLKFEDFFNFNKAVAFRNNRKGLYKSYFWQSMLLCFFYSFIISIPFMVIIAFNPKLSENSMLVLQMLQVNITYILYVLTIPNLTGQIVHQTNSKIKTQNISENQA